jgi:hypothetical protein
MSAEAPFPRDPVEYALPDFFAHHAASGGKCYLCSWSWSPRSRSFALTFISSVCPAHGDLPRGRTHPRATERMRELATVPD